MKYIINYFKYAGRAKGLLAGRIEYLIGFIIYIISSFLLSIITLTNIFLLPESLQYIQYISAPIIIIFLVPFIALIMRRLQDLNINRFLGLLSVPYIWILNLSGFYIAFSLFLVLSIIPSAKVNKYVSQSQILENVNKIHEPRDNPIIGFRPKRFLKILFLFLFLPIILFQIVGFFIFGL